MIAFNTLGVQLRFPCRVFVCHPAEAGSYIEIWFVDVGCVRLEQFIHCSTVFDSYKLCARDNINFSSRVL